MIFADSVRGPAQYAHKTTQTPDEERFERDRQKGRRFRTIRTMVVGIPNVGKSTFINKIAGRAVAATGDRPGVTREAVDQAPS